MADYFHGWFRPTEVNPLPSVASKRTLTAAICDALIQRYTRAALESVLPEELLLDWRHGEAGPDQAETKRDLITGYIEDWSLAELASLARRLSTYADIYQLHQEQLATLVNAYEQGDGVPGKTKNLIFASTGAKPDLVLRDAVSNDIEVVANGDNCLIYDQPMPDGGLRFSHLVAWWATHPSCPPDLDVPGIARHLSAAGSVTREPAGAAAVPHLLRAVQGQPGRNRPRPAGLPALRPARPEDPKVIAERGALGAPTDGLPHVVQRPQTRSH